MTSVLLSYSAPDVVLAERLVGRLRAAGYDVFRDRDREHGILAGTRWAQELFLELDRTDVVVLLGTPASLSSPWCHTEMAVAVARGTFVVQVGLEACPPHPVLVERHVLPAAPDLDALVTTLVADLRRVGLGPTDPFRWDPGRSPYPGLQRFGPAHAAVLFGRAHETAALMARLARPATPPVLVVGPSGSGKSSFVRAAVLPRLALRPGTVVVPAVDPGTAPEARLLAALRTCGPPDPAGALVEQLRRLAATGSRVVVTLDQAEDLLADGVRAQAVRLLAALREAGDDLVSVLVVLRSASLEAWLRDPDLAAATPGDPVWVRPLDRSALREVVVGPARLAGIRVEPPELVDRILDDTGDGQALPLLAALLEELAHGHDRLAPAVISDERYRLLGPVARVVERRAAQAVATLREERGVDEGVVVQACLRLVDLDPDGQVRRAEVPVATLPGEVAGVFAVLEAHRLLVRDRRVLDGGEPAEVVTAVHEQVLRSWPRLREAVEAQRADLALRSTLRAEARAWQVSGRGTPGLSGGRLALAQDWARRRPEQVEGPVRDYVEAARRAARRRRALLVAAPVLAVVLAVVGGLAVSLAVQATRADRARALADGLRLAGQAEQVAPTRPDLALQLALQAAARSPDEQVRAAPFVALTRGPGPRAYQRLDGPATLAALDGDGGRAALVGGTGTRLWDAASGRTVATLPLAGAVALSADGRVVALAPAAPGVVRLATWDDPSAATACPTVEGGVDLLRLDERGDRLVVAQADRSLTPPRTRVQILDGAGCRLLGEGEIDGLVVDADADAADDRLVLAVDVPGSGSGPSVQVWQLGTALPYAPLAAPPGRVRHVAQAGSQVAGLTDTGQLVLWDAAQPQVGPQVLSALSTGGALLRALTPAPTGGARWLAVGEDGHLAVVQPDAAPAVGPALASLPPLDWAGSPVPLAAAATADGAATVDPTGRLVRWDLTGSVDLGDVVDRDQRVSGVVPDGQGGVAVLHPGSLTRLSAAGRSATLPVVAPSAVACRGQTLAVGTADGQLLTSVAGGVLRQVDRRAGPVVAVAVLDGGAIASVDGAGVVEVAGAGAAPTSERTGVQPRSLATDGRHLFLGTRAGAVLVLDPRHPDRAPRAVPAHTADTSALAVSPDGRRLASGGDDRLVRLWDIAADGALTPRQRLAGQGDRVLALAFSPDGAMLAAAGEDRAVLLWDLRRGEQVGQAVHLPAATAAAWVTGTDGSTLLVGGQGLSRWPMSPATWTTAACRVLGGETLGPTERATYLRGSPAEPTCRS